MIMGTIKEKIDTNINLITTSLKYTNLENPICLLVMIILLSKAINSIITWIINTKVGEHPFNKAIYAIGKTKSFIEAEKIS